ncbi:MAG: recombinase family protein [Ruminococcus sp.]|nr:recombinase family protein [Ruminococcus sp.]MBP3797379.1 recombinase family protein [Ruminococcus sp.]
MLPKQTDYKVGMYLRLSRDDERQGESLSIENQRRILTNYVQENGWSIYDTYIDDGISGTTFERPGVQRLLDDAKSGKINLILCKDMSRFGRNYIQVGQYVDYLFPMYNIRFIALTDNIDTANSDSASMDMMPIMNVFNEWHCANTSKKLRTVFHANAKAGKYMATFCTYGYYKADDDKRTPLIDPEAAAVVQRIFKMRASGMGHKSIADALNQEHITPPLDYKYDKLGRTYPLYSHHLWNAQTIRRILDNQMYLGKLVQMKETTVSYKNHKVIRNDESEWVIVENNHEPIISQELWDKVRERDRSVSRGRITTERITSPLSGLCYCDSCGAKMKMQKTPESKSPYSYRCGLHVRYGKSFCTSHNIRGTILEQLILEDIRRQIDFVTNDDKARAKYLARKQGNIALVMAEDNKRKREIEKRLDDLGKLMQKIYEDRVLGNMPDKACAELLEQYQQEKEDLQAELNELRKRFDGYKREEEDVDEFIRRLKSYAGAEELTRQMCLELIEYVTIDKYVDMKTQRDIHIYYKLIDKPLRDKTNALA